MHTTVGDLNMMRISLVRIIILAIVIIFISVAAGYRYQMDRPVLLANQTVSDAAANMTHILEGFGIAGPEIHSAYVRITPDACQVEVTAKYAQTVSVFVAPYMPPT